MRFICTFAMVVIFLSGSIMGTAQFADRIMFEGSEYALFSEPLEAYFAQHGRPQWLQSKGIQSTACWRGYIASWELRNDSLFLSNVSKEYPVAPDSRETEWRDISMTDLIPGATYPLFASWFSGILRLPQGKCMHYVHLGYASRYERDIVIAVDSGHVTARGMVDNKYADKFQSDADREWVALGKPPRDPGKWFDARLFACKEIALLLEQGDTVVTRGIVLGITDKPTLWVPSSDTTEEALCKLTGLPDSALFAQAGDHVEIRAELIEPGLVPTLEILSIRRLGYGETIHSPELPGQMDRCPEIVGHNWLD